MDSYTLDVFVSACREIETIRSSHDAFRRGSKQDFNFFYGLVEKTHLEKYHSNFIAYLLNPNESHGFEGLFLNHFLDLVNVKWGGGSQIKNFSSDALDIRIQKEAPLGGGRVDILITSVNPKWAIFIENKIRSNEGKNQVKDYTQDILGNYKSWLGIYLKDGDLPDSIKNDEEVKRNILPLSYNDIIDWLHTCLVDQKLIPYPFVTGAILQYLEMIKKEFRIMDETEKNKLIEMLTSNKDLGLLAKNIDYLNNIIQDTIRSIRSKFLRTLQFKLEETLKEEKLVNDNSAFKDGSIKLALPKSEPYLFIGQSFPDSEDGGKGLWWGLYSDEHGKTPFNVNSKDNHWEGVKIKGIDDHSDDKKGFQKILENDQDSLVKDIATQITDQIKNLTRKDS